jgi:hypothetical protein
MSVGKEADKTAFELELTSWLGGRRLGELPLWEFRRLAEHLYQFGLRRGEEKRGCCDHA